MTTTVTFLRVAHGDPSGKEALGRLLVRFKENKLVMPTSGMVPAWCAVRVEAEGRSEIWCSETAT